MKILCIDTSSNLCSVAILENTTLINKLELNNGLTHSETLMPLIKNLLDSSKINLKDIDLLAVDIGPGSFTGLRIGIATVKAFSDSLNIPCVGISSLEILAYNIKDNGIICSTIDCKNNNCYFALYELNSNNYTILEEPQADSIENIMNLLNSKYTNKSIYFVGDGIKKETSSNYLNIENLGIAAFKKFNDNFINENILPLYLKKPQAQQQLEEKMKNSK
ncbi:MAG: tRNA (adenosine(37)-N6)-threonylcarbamoyltransferase complex dimerization subunit type 1 TsaB [Clostridia bacterium]|nr:tRNA (adenosine(37)-N6)-threonylcarbamoyltransferase complex dimerization subunit type 1 TsaB [Clostridia bacterium]